MTLDDEVKSLLAIERYLRESKTDTCIILDELAKLVQAHVAPITITVGETWGAREWIFHKPDCTNTCSVALNNAIFSIRFHWQQTTRQYEISNPEFPDNLLTDIEEWL